VNLLPGNKDALKLARQPKTLSELLLETPRWHAPRLERKAVLHTHCHHKSVLDAAAERKLLESMGLELSEPAPGCCGHAGSFGYESERHPISIQIAEQALLPGVRGAPREALVIADGFSCRQQIKDGAGRWAMHPAEVIALALEARGALPQEIPEHRYLEDDAKPQASALAALGLCATVGLFAVNAAARRAQQSNGHWFATRRL
jgi:Fe-S oxidoreductase